MNEFCGGLTISSSLTILQNPVPQGGMVVVDHDTLFTS